MQITIKDIPVYYDIRGEGRPMVMLHGWSPDHRLMTGCMEPVFDEVHGGWQRLYFDLPGMGKTPGADWINGSDAMLEFVMAFIDALLPGQSFAVAGESYGGYLARGLVKKWPARVDGVLLICPVAKQETQLEHAPAFQVLEKDETLLKTLTEEEKGYFCGINVVQTERVWLRYKEEIIPGLKLADYEFLSKYLGQHVPFSFDTDTLDQPYMKPSLFVMGRQDHMVGYRDHWDLVENYPRASFIVLDKAGHNLPIEQDVLFTALVKEWMGRVEADRDINW